MTPRTIVRLDTGYWHVRFGGDQFVQWPVDRTPTLQDAFHCYEDAVASAAKAVADGLAAGTLLAHPRPPSEAR